MKHHDVVWFRHKPCESSPCEFAALGADLAEGVKAADIDVERPLAFQTEDDLAV